MQFQQYLRMIQKSWWIIVITTLAALLFALVTAYSATPQYRSSARFIISPNSDIITGRDIVNSLATLDKRSIAVTYAEVLGSNRLLQETASALGVELAQLKTYTISSVVLPEANILEVTTVGPDPVMAAQVTNEVGKQGISYISQLYPAYELSVLDGAIPATDPFSPQPVRDSSLAGALGILAGVMLAIVRGYLRMPIQMLRERVQLDPASGAHTQRYMQRALDAQLLHGVEPTSCMLIHIDELKDYLDVLPETSANRLLYKVNAILRNQLRGQDIVGRWTKSSFVVMLPATPEVAAHRTADRIRIALETPVKLDLHPEPFALSTRIVVVTKQEGEAPDAVITRLEQGHEHSTAIDSSSLERFNQTQKALV
jgi:diguanylate cyclase (GGDEF)-like protein